MIEVGVEEKSGSFVASVLHLPTNVIKKSSTKNAEDSVASCLNDVLEDVRNRNWLTVTIGDTGQYDISINSLYFLQIPKSVEFEIDHFLEKLSINVLSIHLFRYSQKKYTSYNICRSTKVEIILKNLLLVPGIELACS